MPDSEMESMHQDSSMNQRRGRSSERGGPRGSAASKTLYMSNLPPTYDSDKIRDLVGANRLLTDCRVIVNPITKESRCFGFVAFEVEEDASEVLERLNGTVCDDRTISVEFARRNRPHEPTPGQYKGVASDSRRGGRDRSRSRPRRYESRRDYRSDDSPRRRYDSRGRGGRYDDRRGDRYRDHSGDRYKREKSRHHDSPKKKYGRDYYKEGDDTRVGGYRGHDEPRHHKSRSRSR